MSLMTKDNNRFKNDRPLGQQLIPGFQSHKKGYQPIFSPVQIPLKPAFISFLHPSIPAARCPDDPLTRCLTRPVIPTNKFVFNNYYVIQGVPDDFTYKVFISHSWDDKERFVTEFAIKLRGRGVDAWVDQWEMMPGDSLVRKIFCEGIQNAEAFIIVLSKNSVQKKWVKEELDLAVVKK